jgi:hypothetical protein
VNWKRHRRVLGPQFSEDLNEFVWNQATTLALDMFKSWDKSSSPIPKHMLTMRKAGRNREHTDLCTLALRVITGSSKECPSSLLIPTADTCVVFNVMVPFSLDTNQREDPGLDNFTVEAADFSGALEVVTDNLITFMILPRWLLAITGKRGRKLIKSFQEVAEFMSKTINQNKESDHSISRRTTFLTGLTNALASSKSSDKSTELTYDEITGNLFLLGLAGSETTADTMHFAFLLLAMHGDAQDWVLAQIDEAHRELGSEWSYMKAIPKLKFIHLLMVCTWKYHP